MAIKLIVTIPNCTKAILLKKFKLVHRRQIALTSDRQFFSKICQTFEINRILFNFTDKSICRNMIKERIGDTVLARLKLFSVTTMLASFT